MMHMDQRKWVMEKRQLTNSGGVLDILLTVREAICMIDCTRDLNVHFLVSFSPRNRSSFSKLMSNALILYFLIQDTWCLSNLMRLLSVT